MTDADVDIPAGGEALLHSIGLRAPFTGQRLAGGRNNQVFKVTDAAGQRVALKSYFHDPDDHRDRLSAEHAFVTEAARLGITCVPRPLARDDAHHLGVYSFMEGVLATPEDVTPDAMAQAVSFVLGMNPRDDRRVHAGLSTASEACFSAEEHLRTIETRLNRLTAGFGGSAVERDAARFITHEANPAWAQIRARAHRGLEDLGIGLSGTVTGENRIFSPSDFGFHNALKRADGTFAFLDFEYAGWDDPAKLVGDAFNQVKVPLPGTFYPSFRDRVAAWSGRPEAEARRYDLMLPVYAMKWIVIMLNEFVPAGDRRRVFAGSAEEIDARRAAQLNAARVKLARLPEDYKISVF